MGRVRALAALVALALVTVVAAGCAKTADTPPGTSGSRETKKLTLVSYAVASEAYARIIPAFKEYWKARTGEDVKFTESYGGSGTQARAVVDGLEADIVHLAMEPDVAEIEKAGLIDTGWQREAPENSIPATSLIVFGVREGNPKAIADWSDLGRPGIGVVTPDPKTSGGARWNVLAAYGSVTQTGGTENAAKNLLSGIFKNTLVLDKNAREAGNTFLKKDIGDAAVLWESDALIGQSAGERFEIVYPPKTVLAETAVAVVDSVAKKKGNEEVAKAFIEFLYTPESQKTFAEAGLRPVSEEVLTEYSSKYPEPRDALYSIDDFGGWSAADLKFFEDGAIYDQVASEVAGSR